VVDFSKKIGLLEGFVKISLIRESIFQIGIDKLKYRNIRPFIKPICSKHDVMEPLRVHLMKLDFYVAHDIAMPTMGEINAFSHPCD